MALPLPQSIFHYFDFVKCRFDGEIKIKIFEVFGFYFLGSVGLSGLNVGRLRNESAMTVFVGFLDGEREISNPRIFVINRVGFKNRHGFCK
jgi:hypothetical protein